MWNKEELRLLSNMTGVINCFAKNEDDEFTITREDGRIQGIFKTWAAPFIAFLDLGGLETLEIVWPTLMQKAHLGLTFEESLKEIPQAVATEIVETIDRWAKLCRDNPDFFRRSLNRVVNNTFEIDRLMLRLYDQKPLDPNPKKRLGQLLNRFRTALGLMGPFYHLEVIVANQTSRWSVLKEGDFGDGGGELDALVFFLPAIFAGATKAIELEQLYQECRERTHKVNERVSPEERLLWRVSKVFGFDPIEIIFASERLQTIPVRVGGKKEDLPKETAIARVEEVLSRKNGDDSLVAIARDINAEIRFNNWLLTEEPVTGTAHSRYGSVCEPIRQLRELLAEHPEFWKDSKLAVFNKMIAPQIDNLDAESAQGRLFWSLLVTEGWLCDEFYPLEEGEDLVTELNFIQPLSILGQKSQGARLFGDKGANLSVVSQIKPLSRESLEGKVLDSIAVELLLLSPLKVQIRRMIAGESLRERLAIAQEIRDGLDKIPLTGLQTLLRRELGASRVGSWAVRSSCFGEDDAKVPSAGIYQSQLDVGVEDLASATRETVKSWFSEMAVAHRYLASQSDLPLVAVVYQPFLSAQGGVVEVRSQEPTITVYYANIPSQVTSGGPTSQVHFSVNDLNGVTPESQAARVAFNLAQVFGELDVEWVFHQDGVKVLQLKTVRKVIREVKRVDHWVSLDPNNLVALEKKLQEKEGVYGLVLTKPVNLEQFQGDIFGVIARNGFRIGTIRLSQPVASSCHFANICSGHGIILEVV